MRSVFCNWAECPYSSAGGWCQLDNPRWVPQAESIDSLRCYRGRKGGGSQVEGGW